MANKPGKKKTKIVVREKGGTPVAARPKGRLLVDEQVAILRLRQDGKSIQAIADIIERSYDCVRAFIAKWPDTRPLAEAVFQRGAVTMAQHVLERGTVDNHIDVLSRPNMGVLAPVAKGGGGGGLSFQISVTTASLGVVKVDSDPAPTEKVVEGSVVR